MARIGSLPWPLASLVVGIAFYMLFLLAAYVDGFAVAALNNSDSWGLSLVPAIMLVYSLLAIPILHRLMTRAIEVFRSMVPLNDRFRRLELEAYSLKRRREWLAVGLGTLVGWILLRPPWSLSHLSAPHIRFNRRCIDLRLGRMAYLCSSFENQTSD